MLSVINLLHDAVYLCFRATIKIRILDGCLLKEEMQENIIFHQNDEFIILALLLNYKDGQLFYTLFQKLCLYITKVKLSIKLRFSDPTLTPAPSSSNLKLLTTTLGFLKVRLEL